MALQEDELNSDEGVAYVIHHSDTITPGVDVPTNITLLSDKTIRFDNGTTTSGKIYLVRTEPKEEFIPDRIPK